MRLWKRSLLPLLVGVMAVAWAGDDPKQPAPAGGGGLAGDLYAALEQLLAKELPKRVAEADRWEVKLSRDGNDLSAGKFARLDVKGVNLRLPDGLTIGEASLTLQDLKVNMAMRSLESIGQGQLVGRLAAGDIERYLRQRGPARLKDVRVTFQDGQIQMGGIADLRRLGIPVEVAGLPQARGSEIDFQADRVEVARFRLPRVAVRELERRVNPIVDLRRLKIPVNVTRVTLQDDRLVLEAALDFSAGLPNLGRKKQGDRVTR